MSAVLPGDSVEVADDGNDDLGMHKLVGGKIRLDDRDAEIARLGKNQIVIKGVILIAASLGPLDLMHNHLHIEGLQSAC